MNNDTSNSENPFASQDAATVASAPASSHLQVSPTPNTVGVSDVFGWFQNAILLLKDHWKGWLKFGAIITVAMVAIFLVIILSSLVSNALAGVVVGLLTLAAVVLGICSVHLVGGLFYTLHQQHETKHFQLSNMLAGFKDGNLLPLFGVYFLNILCFVAIMIIYGIVSAVVVMLAYVSSIFGAILAIVLAPVILIAMFALFPVYIGLYAHVPLLVIQYKMPVIASIQLVLKGVVKNIIPLAARSVGAYVVVMLCGLIPFMLMMFSLMIFGVSGVGSAGSPFGFFSIGTSLYTILFCITFLPLLFIAYFSGILIDLKSSYYAFRNIYLQKDAHTEKTSMSQLF